MQKTTLGVVVRGDFWIPFEQTEDPKYHWDVPVISTIDHNKLIFMLCWNFRSSRFRKYVGAFALLDFTNVLLLLNFWISQMCWNSRTSGFRKYVETSELLDFANVLECSNCLISQMSWNFRTSELRKCGGAFELLDSANVLKLSYFWILQMSDNFITLDFAVGWDKAQKP